MEPEDKLTEQTREVVASFVQVLVQNNVTLLCLDFDLTVCNIHTGGVAVHSNCCRPVFALLAKEAHNAGVKTCIVTFHSLHQEVQAEVKRAFAVPVEEDYVVKGALNVNLKNLHQGIRPGGKMPHISNAWREVFEESTGADGLHPSELELSKVFLIDDDANNVELGIKAGVHSICFDPEKDLAFFLAQLQQGPVEGFEKYLEPLQGSGKGRELGEVAAQKTVCPNCSVC